MSRNAVINTGIRLNRHGDGSLTKKFSLSGPELSEVHSVISEASKQPVLQIDPTALVCRDADDDKILACAHKG
jgi:hypothetical protein